MGKPWGILSRRRRVSHANDLFKLNSEIIIDLYEVVRNNTVVFTQFLQMVVSCKTVVQYHNQEVDIDTVNIQNIYLHHFRDP